MITPKEAMRQKVALANLASEGFDFVQEGSLATFWRQATPGTTYWRGYLPMKHLPGSVVKLHEKSLEYDDDTKTLSLPEQHGDTVIWQFLGDDGRSRIALQMRRQGLHTLMELDDNYLRFAPTLYGKHGAWTKTHADAMRNGTGYSIEMHRKVVPQMDGLIVSTDNLANEYEAFLAKAGAPGIPITVAPNSVDPEDWDVERSESDVLRIGYYGSPSHFRDWPLVKKAMKWAQRQDGVEVSLIGFSPAGWTGKTVPWQDNLFDARAALGHIDVGIAPLTVNPWSVGKSDVKALEYAMAGVMPIVQDAEPYYPWVDSGWQWCPRTEADWGDVIRDVVAKRDDVKAMAGYAKDYVLRERTIESNIHHWREAISGP